MSFPKAPTKRFNETPSCAPPPGLYDPKVKECVANTIFERTDRFKIPKDPGPGPGSYLSLSSGKSARRLTCLYSSSTKKTNSLNHLEKTPSSEQEKQFGSAPNLTETVKGTCFEGDEIKRLRSRVQELSQRLHKDEQILSEFRENFNKFALELQKSKENEKELFNQLNESIQKSKELESLLVSERNNFSDKDTTLNQQLIITKDSLSTSEKEIQELKSQVQNLEEQLEEKQNLMLLLEGNNDKLNVDIKNIDEKLKHSEDIIFSLRKKLQTSEERLKDSEATIFSLNEKFQAITERLKNSDNKVHSLTQDRHSLERNLKDSIDNVCLLNQENHALEEKVKGGEEAVFLLNKKIQAIEESLKLTEDTVHSLKKIEISFEEKLKESKDNECLLTNENQIMKEKLEEGKNTIHSLTKEKCIIEEKLSVGEDAMNLINAAKQQIECRLKAVEEKLKDSENTVQLLNEQKLATEIVLKENEATLHSLNKSKQTIEKNLIHSEHTIYSLNEENKHLSHEVQILTKAAEHSLEEKVEHSRLLEIYLSHLANTFLTHLANDESGKNTLLEKLEPLAANFIHSFNEKMWEARLAYNNCQKQVQLYYEKIVEMQLLLHQETITVAELKNESEKKSLLIERLSAKNESLLKETNSHLKKIECLKTEVCSLKDEISQNNGATDTLTNTLEEKENIIKKINSEVQVLEDRLFQNTSLVKQLEDKLKENDEKINCLISEKNNLSCSTNKYLLELSNNELILKELKAQLTEKDTCIDELSSQIEIKSKESEKLIIYQENLQKKMQQKNDIISNFEIENNLLLEKLQMHSDQIPSLQKDLEKKTQHLEETKQKLSNALLSVNNAEDEKADLQNQLCCLQQENTHLSLLKKEVETNCDARIKQLKEDKVVLMCDMEEMKSKFEKRLMEEINRNEEFEKDIADAIMKLQIQMSNEKDFFNRALEESSEKLAFLEVQHEMLSKEKEAELSDLRNKFISQDELFKEKINFVEELRHNLTVNMQDKIDQFEIESQRWKQLYEELLAKIEPFKEQLEAYEIEYTALLSQNNEAEEDLDRLTEQYAQLLSHQNHKQKIKHVMKMKTEIMNLKKEVFRQRDVIAKQTSFIKKLQDETGSRKSKYYSVDKENLSPYLRFK